jgi:hypothetical protein
VLRVAEVVAKLQLKVGGAVGECSPQLLAIVSGLY